MKSQEYVESYSIDNLIISFICPIFLKTMKMRGGGDIDRA
jgi:hypothetical protein